MEPALLIVGFIVLAVVIRLMAGAFDEDRVEQYIRDMGCELIILAGGVARSADFRPPYVLRTRAD